MAQCMYAQLTKYINKTFHAHSNIHSMTWPQYSTTIPMSVSSGTPVGNKFTATYVGMVVE